MPRGRHRHSPPLHRTLPPSVIAGVSIVCAVAPWLFTEPMLLRGLAAGAAMTTVVGSFIMRRWDVAATKRVADLTRAQANDEWRHEERVAELETDLEESRELRTKLEHKLRAKRAELAKLRNEHAALLRRYATAETERASALEGRRLLAIETTTPTHALPSAQSTSGTEATPSVESSAVRAFSAEGSSLFARADAALERLAGRNTGTPEQDATSASASAQEGDAAEGDAPAAGPEHAPAPAAQYLPALARPTQGAGNLPVSTAVAVVPSTPRRRPAVEGGFDFFGRQKEQDSPEPQASEPQETPESLDAVQHEDLADVVGQEALAAHQAESASGAEPAEPKGHALPQVIDLTAHDETERIDIQDIQKLRTAAS
ncbi:hypothetical protein NGF19_13135 [Streptomyces sp. RY43-2]|uniref:Secreted protein n=1 Tax=Streptomyces macrolidinus TaxID=2952607 RepID=A0ABT0ZDR0_9ACTN|nr:hypothetical protein [Streptomyces macrolidinus]MCN9241726.1 hypothetical protein [Streptomyces macrolidinus]